MHPSFIVSPASSCSVENLFVVVVVVVTPLLLVVIIVVGESPPPFPFLFHFPSPILVDSSSLFTSFRQHRLLMSSCGASQSFQASSKLPILFCGQLAW